MLAIISDARSVILEVAERFKLKKDKFPLEIYLGERLAKKSMNVKDIWTVSSVDYVKGIINHVEVCIQCTSYSLTVPQ